MLDAVNSPARRREVLGAYGASSDELVELLAYNQNEFRLPDTWPRFPLASEPFVEAWQEYAHEVQRSSNVDALFARFPQMNFPVAEGISKSPEYRAATQQGAFVPRLPPLSMAGCNVAVHQALAGAIPVITAATRDQFVWLVQAFAHKNEPVRVPPSMGACFVSGYVNWDRIRSLRDAFRTTQPDGNWSPVFQQIKADKALYQDRFILLSRDAYSGVPAAALGVDPDTWPNLSCTLRLEHECTHYFTKRVFGSMRNNVADELIADYAGICAAQGKFQADWLLRFWGLHDAPVYHPGGRLENYRGSLSDGSFHVLQQLVTVAVHHLQTFDNTLTEAQRTPECQALVLAALASLPLELLAHPSCPATLGDLLTERSPSTRSQEPCNALSGQDRDERKQR